jgi:beta-phosphoglucomutase
MLRGVVFDFDGVIVDSHPVHKRAWKRLLDSVGKAISEEELEFVVDGRRRDDILRHFLGDLDPERIVEYGHRKEQFFREEAAGVQTISGLLSFLRELEEADVVLGVASSGSRSRVSFLLSRLKLTKHFQVIVTGDDVERGKPDPAIFLRVAKDLQRESSELLAFEDAVSGVKAAKAAGMRCVGIAQPASAAGLLAAGADPVVSDFRPLSHSKLEEIFG